MGKKATFVLDETVIAQAKEIVEKGVFKSMNAFVESAIKDEIERIKKDNIRQAIIRASKDPLFLSDIKEVEKDFEYADFDEGNK
ncbi:MAG: hypothetical protein Q8M34_08630 [Thermodesulfovibrionales bacterium]|nr:hypothetical protein [Thermodesulfovibrionales bacterium]